MYTNIKSFEDACAARGIDPLQLPIVTGIPERHQRAIVSTYKMNIIVEAINNDEPGVPDWQPDYNDEDQYKYFPWFRGGSNDGSGSGFRFSDTSCAWTDADTDGGARFAFKDDERAEYAGKTFADIYKEIFLFLK